MEEKTLQNNITKLTEDLKTMAVYNEFYTDIQKLSSSPNVQVDNFKDTLIKEIKDSGLETKLRNNVYHWAQNKKDALNPNLSDHIYLRKAQIQWDKRVHKSLQSMCSELGVYLAKIRTNQDKEDIQEKWTEMSTYDVDVHMYRPVYAPKDFAEVILALHPTKKRKPGQPKWDFSHLPLKVKTLCELRKLYPEFTKGEALLGVNPYIISSSNYWSLEAERMALGEKVLFMNHAPIAQEYLKKGCPRCYRARLWSLILGTEIKPSHRLWFEQLKESVLHLDLMIDKLIIKDIHLTAANDDQYFVFEDVLFQVKPIQRRKIMFTLRKHLVSMLVKLFLNDTLGKVSQNILLVMLTAVSIMLCFSRDTEVLSKLSQKTQMQVVIKGKQPTVENTIIFPPSGVIPFHGFTMYAAPFCYLFDDPVALYFTFRAFYLRYWHRLHKVCNHPQGIVSLCLLFERLLQCHEPNLWSHFKNHNIHPIRVVFKWLMRAFSGHLPPEQLLYLWDAILAYDSLELIPLLAVTIISLRKENLMQVTTLLNIEAVLADLSSILVMPLLQTALFKEYCPS